MGGFSDGPASIRVWRERLNASDPDAWERAMHRRHDTSPPTLGADADATCSQAKAMMALVNDATGQHGKDFFDHLQFVNQDFRIEQDAVDAASGLKNTGELSNALFSHGLACYRFTQYSRITMPVLVIAGRFDGAIGVEPQRQLAARLPNATFLQYEHSAHFPYLQETKRFSADVTAFLATH
ncbi:MAG TPA: alpha/beta hydrolase [Bryobacteraceae bacterium]|nr:alpha/beta hydrolase [Bryobacteraceae bacterium]